MKLNVWNFLRKTVEHFNFEFTWRPAHTFACISSANLRVQILHPRLRNTKQTATVGDIISSNIYFLYYSVAVFPSEITWALCSWPNENTRQSCHATLLTVGDRLPDKAYLLERINYPHLHKWHAIVKFASDFRLLSRHRWSEYGDSMGSEDTSLNREMHNGC